MWYITYHRFSISLLWPIPKLMCKYTILIHACFQIDILLSKITRKCFYNNCLMEQEKSFRSFCSSRWILSKCHIYMLLLTPYVFVCCFFLVWCCKKKNMDYAEHYVRQLGNLLVQCINYNWSKFICNAENMNKCQSKRARSQRVADTISFSHFLQ